MGRCSHTDDFGRKMIEQSIRREVETACSNLYGLEPQVEFVIEREGRFGDLTTNVAFSLSKTLKKSPHEIASKIADRVRKVPLFERVEVGGDGFLNFYLKRQTLCDELKEIFSRAETYGSLTVGKRERVLIEFVSANPTGPLLVVNARAAAIGDSLARTMNFAGYHAESEYYVNDAGHQVELLAQSVVARYHELLGETGQLPEQGYRGEYVRALAQELLEKKVPLSSVREYVLERIVKQQAETLDAFRVSFDHWVRESEIRGRMKEVETSLVKRNAAYMSDGALWLASSRFGDEKDRVLVKRTGEPTYVLPDLAYHSHKFSRGFNRLINIWGPDHHGYISRIKAGMEALGYPPERLQILIAQQVNLIRGGEKIMMSRREGEFITMAQLLDDVGVDAARFFFLLRRNSSHLDFDVDLARKTSQDNPVYYVQYGHARISSIMRYAEQSGVDLDLISRFQSDRLMEEEELSLIKSLMLFPAVVQRVSSTLDPHSIPYYLMDLATVFHNFYQKHRVVSDDRDLTLARLALVETTRAAVNNGLRLIGVSAPLEM